MIRSTPTQKPDSLLPGLGLLGMLASVTLALALGLLQAHTHAPAADTAIAPQALRSLLANLRAKV
ncbi:hypothetical protein [Pseudomonas sp. BMS12]|uniref:hypothetical protein n=1 Tax=Pseudomonas sp. BMS12 TaxID=1796033 RepID=UPI000839D9C8|nr:hypothetical protein [Pseudomonas sp. BMS12]